MVFVIFGNPRINDHRNICNFLFRCVHCEYNITINLFTNLYRILGVNEIKIIEMKKLLLICVLGILTVSCATTSTISETSVVKGVELSKRPKKGKFIVITEDYKFRTNTNFQIGDKLRICK